MQFAQAWPCITQAQSFKNHFRRPKIALIIAPAKEVAIHSGTIRIDAMNRP